ncbi:MAG: hypothetical protein IPJ65_34380 [Archangiaceae bacterium]|nr:hypothetical protein [Archangiaceae bacterium]
MRTFLALAVAVACLWVLSCNSGASSADGGMGGAGGGEGGGGAGSAGGNNRTGVVTVARVCAPTFVTPDAGRPDSGTPTDAGASDAGASDAGPFDAGLVDAGPFDAGLVAGGVKCTGYASASFTQSPPAGCTPLDAGPCQMVVCSLANGPVRAHLENAGAVSITGTTLGTIRLNYLNPDAGYPGFSSTRDLFDGGETLSMGAAGADVPAFAPRSVIAPGPIALTAPGCDGGCGTFSRTAALTVSWAGDAGVAVLFSSASSTTVTTAECHFTQSPGEVPLEVMKLFGATADGFTNSVSISPESRTTFVNAGWNLSVRAWGPGVSGSFE